MSENQGYKGKALEFLKQNNINVGDFIKILSELTYEGILMPRFEQSDDVHIVLKLKSGYNIGLELEKIEKVELISPIEKSPEAKEEVIQDSSLPKILLLSTGGTIASKIDYRTGAVTPVLTAAELNASVPELAKIANIETEVILSEYSENLQPDDWKKIAEKLDSYAKSDYKGIIIAHGTDTMHYTSSFLSFALSGFSIPIALVGSQRSSDRPSSDAALNLISAAKFLISDVSSGVFVVMHMDESDDTIACHYGTRVRKNHTSKRGAFETIGGNPTYLVIGDKIVNNSNENFFSNSSYEPKLDVNTKVALVKYHPGLDPKIIEHLIEQKYKAIIFEGTGLGHIGKTMYDAVKHANENQIFLGMTSQCIDGRVRMTVYESGRDLMDLGIVPLNDMIPETALVKAMWVLGNFQTQDDIKENMLRRIANEFSD